MDENVIKLEFTTKELVDLMKSTVAHSIEKAMVNNKENIDISLKQYFKKSIFDDRKNDFENALDWAIEACFRTGVEKAMTELNFQEVVCQKAKELLSDNNFVAEIAMKKVMASLGLKQD